MTLAMVDSMPERLLHFKPVKEVRDFAQQIAHAAVPVAVFAASAKGREAAGAGGFDGLPQLQAGAAGDREQVVRLCAGSGEGVERCGLRRDDNLREVHHDAVADPGTRPRAQCLDPRRAGELLPAQRDGAAGVRSIRIGGWGVGWAIDCVTGKCRKP